MNSISVYLISGVATNATGDYLPVKQMTNFAYTVRGFATGTMPPTGRVDIQMRLDGEDNWFNIFTKSFSGAGSDACYFSGPIKDTRATITSRTAGAYDVICMYDNVSSKVISFSLSGVDGGSI
jgi:hypothetical protein